jgi:hypothetical protein
MKSGEYAVLNYSLGVLSRGTYRYYQEAEDKAIELSRESKYDDGYAVVFIRDKYKVAERQNTTVKGLQDKHLVLFKMAGLGHTASIYGGVHNTEEKAAAKLKEAAENDKYIEVNDNLFLAQVDRVIQPNGSRYALPDNYA